MSHIKRFVFFAVLFAAFSGCDNPKPASSDEVTKLQITVSIAPEAFFAQRIGQGRLDIQVMVPPGASPATYEPTPKQMTRLAETKLYFTAGVPFERALVSKIAKIFAHIKIVATEPAIDSHSENFHTDDSHTDNPHTDDPHTDNPYSDDPHTWLDPVMAKDQARIIAAALIEADPAGQAQYQQGLAELIKDLDQVNSEIADLLGPHAGKEILVFHPAYGHFTRRFGLKQLAIQIQGKAPSAKQLTELIQTARASGFQIIFVQRQFSAKTASVVARQIGATVVEIDPLSGDYLSNLRVMASAIEQGVRKK